jgi:hypothetical protein
MTSDDLPHQVHPQTSGKLGYFAFFGKLLGCSLLQRELNLDLELSDNVWKRIAGEVRVCT